MIDFSISRRRRLAFPVTGQLVEAEYKIEVSAPRRSLTSLFSLHLYRSCASLTYRYSHNGTSFIQAP
jgi:hypothetical protein